MDYVTGQILILNKLFLVMSVIFNYFQHLFNIIQMDLTHSVVSRCKNDGKIVFSVLWIFLSLHFNGWPNDTGIMLFFMFSTFYLMA